MCRMTSQEMHAFAEEFVRILNALFSANLTPEPKEEFTNESLFCVQVRVNLENNFYHMLEVGVVDEYTMGIDACKENGYLDLTAPDQSQTETAASDMFDLLLTVSPVVGFGKEDLVKALGIPCSVDLYHDPVKREWTIGYADRAELIAEWE